MVSFPVINLLKNKSLLVHLSVQDLKKRYRSSYLGFVWTVLEPLLMFLILFIVFSNIYGRDEHFAVYLITGIMIFHIFTRGTMGGLVSLSQNNSILKTFKIQNEIFPVASTGAIMILMFVEMVLLFSLMPVFNFVPTFTIALMPIVMVLLLILILGVSYILSILFVLIRDVQMIWSVTSYSLMFLSPIFWRLENMEGVLLIIHNINPLGLIIELGHKTVLGQIPPLNDWAYASSIVFGILFIGYVFFRKLEKKAIEEL